MKKIIKWIIIIIISSILYMRFIGTYGLKVNEYSIIDNNLPNSFDGIKIVHLSDIHYGTTVTEKNLKYIVEKINKLKPDIIIFTGDLYDESVNISDDTKNNIINTLNQLEATIGKYAIIGNHDFARNDYEDIITKSGFTYLNNTSTLIYNNDTTPIEIIGIDDILKGTPNYNISSTANYKITLVHEPDAADNITSNLIFAGHSHGGQIRLPIIGSIYTPDGATKYTNDYYELNNSKLYISYGIGTSVLKFRLFDRPSISLYRLYTN